MLLPRAVLRQSPAVPVAIVRVLLGGFGLQCFFPVGVLDFSFCLIFWCWFFLVVFFTIFYCLLGFVFFLSSTPSPFACKSVHQCRKCPTEPTWGSWSLLVMFLVCTPWWQETNRILFTLCKSFSGGNCLSALKEAHLSNTAFTAEHSSNLLLIPEL